MSSVDDVIGNFYLDVEVVISFHRNKSNKSSLVRTH